LQRGDEILEVNGYDFTSITHDKAVQILKSSRKMTLLAHHVGKIPSDLNSTPSSSSSGKQQQHEDLLIDLKASQGSTGQGGSSNLITTNMSSTFDEDDEDFDLIEDEDDDFDHKCVLDFTKQQHHLHQHSKVFLIIRFLGNVQITSFHGDFEIFL
jgi:hypothetical protein